MTINWWTLGLQAVNFLILVWLLSRVFWRPVAAAIVSRQTAANTLLDNAKSSRTKADAELCAVTATREGLKTERVALLANAQAKAVTEAETILETATIEAESILTAAQRYSEHERDVTRASDQADAALLAVDIASKLLKRLDTITIQTSFSNLLGDAINRLSPEDKQALLSTEDGIDLISAHELDKVAKAAVTVAIGKVLGGEPSLNFLSDSNLIAGFELRTAHFALSNSWHSDLEAIQKDLKNAA